MPINLGCLACTCVPWGQQARKQPPQAWSFLGGGNNSHWIIDLIIKLVLCPHYTQFEYALGVRMEAEGFPRCWFKWPCPACVSRSPSREGLESFGRILVGHRSPIQRLELQPVPVGTICSWEVGCGLLSSLTIGKEYLSRFSPYLRLMDCFKLLSLAR